MKFFEAFDLYLLTVLMAIKLNSWLPSAKLRDSFVRLISLVAYNTSRNKRNLGTANLWKALGNDLTQGQGQRIIRESFYETWKDICSLLPARSDKESIATADIRGLEYLETALNQDKGIILWESGGFGRRQATRQILHSKGFSLCVAHSENHLGGFGRYGPFETWIQRKVIRPFFDRQEKRFVESIIDISVTGSLSFVRTIQNHLRRNEIVCIRGDGKQGTKLIAFESLGQKDLFATGMVSLAKTSGTSILPIFCMQDESGEMRSIIERPIGIDSSLGREESLHDAVSQYVRLLESYIRRYPGKYRTWHVVGRAYQARYSGAP
jgi:lauroyl/myristoyl acyltransferase